MDYFKYYFQILIIQFITNPSFAQLNGLNKKRLNSSILPINGFQYSKGLNSSIWPINGTLTGTTISG